MSEVPDTQVKTEISFPAVFFKQSDRSCFLGKVPIRKIWWILEHLKGGSNLERSQRKINEHRLPKIKAYVNQDNYVIPPVVLTVEGFVGDTKNRKVTLPDDCTIWINDGQHRLYALKDIDSSDDIPVMILPYVNRDLCSQNFTDLNKNLVKPNKSLQIYFDQRNVFARYVLEKVVRKDEIEFQETTVKGNSEKQYAFGSMFNALKTLNGGDKEVNDKVNQHVNFYNAVRVLWLKGRANYETVREYREKSIFPHGIMLDILSTVARKIFEAHDGNTIWIDSFQRKIEGLPIPKDDWFWHTVMLEGILIKKKTHTMAAALSILSRD